MKTRRGVPGSFLLLSLVLVSCSPCAAAGAVDVADGDGKKTVEELARELGHFDVTMRREAAYALDQLGEEAREAVPALTRALGDKDQQVWFFSVSALARIGPDASPAIDALIRGFSSYSRYRSQTWYRSAYALGQIGPAAVPALLQALESETETTRSGAAKALGWIGPEAKDAVDALLEGLADPAEDVRRQSLLALGRVGKSAIAALTRVLEEKNRDLEEAHDRRLGALGALLEMEGDSSESARSVIPLLSDSSWEIRRRAVSILRFGENSGDNLALCVRLLGDENESVRLAAVDALLKIPLSSQEKVAALVSVLDGGEPRAVDAAALALGRMGPEASGAVGALTNALLERERVEAGTTLGEALGRLGPAGVEEIIRALGDPRLEGQHLEVLAGALTEIGSSALEELLGALSDSSPGIRAGAAETLGRMGPGARSTIAALTKSLEDEDTGVRVRAAGALGRLGLDGAKVKEIITRLLEDETSDVRAAAMRALGHTDLETAELLLYLGQGLRDPDVAVQAHALEVLSTLGDEAAGAVPDLVKLLESSDPRVREETTHVLGEIGSGARDAAAALTVCMADSNLDVRVGAIRATGKIGAGGKTVPALIRALEHEEEEVQLAAAKALGDMGTDAREALPTLEDAFLFGEPELSDASARALHSIGLEPDSLVPLLVECLEKRRSSRVRLTAMEILSRIGPDAQEAVPILFKLLDSEYDRSMAYRTLREIGPRSIPILTDSLDHRSQFVRSLACEYLGRLGPEAREAVPQLTRLSEREKEPRVRRAASEALKRIRRGRQRS